jgi:putative transposase
MRRAYRFLLRPASKRAQTLVEMLRDHCSLYHGVLRERRAAYRHVWKTSIRCGDQSAQLTEIRAFDPQRQGRWSFSSRQATLRRRDRAFAAFFRRVTAGGKPGYPLFSWRELVRHGGVRRGTGMAAAGTSTLHDPVTRVRLHGVGHVRVHQHRPVKGRVTTISVQREGRRCSVVLAGDEVPAEPLAATGAVTGIDNGVEPCPHHRQGRAHAEPRARQAHRRCPRRCPARGDGVALVRAGQPNRPASPCGGERRHAASQGAPPAVRITRARPPWRWSGSTTWSRTNGGVSRPWSLRHNPEPDPGNAGAFVPNASRSEGRVEQEHPRRGLGGVVGHPRAQR